MPIIDVRDVCPDCHTVSAWRQVEAALLYDDVYSKSGDRVVACSTCHKKRRARIREIESRYPSAEQAGHTAPVDPIVFVRPGGGGRRVIRKPGLLGG